MQASNGLIFSRDKKAISFFQQVCLNLDIHLDCIQDIKGFLLRIMEGADRCPETGEIIDQLITIWRINECNNGTNICCWFV